MFCINFLFRVIFTSGLHLFRNRESLYRLMIPMITVLLHEGGNLFFHCFRCIIMLYMQNPFNASSEQEKVDFTLRWLDQFVMSRIPTQSRRTEQTNLNQQFSTPPTIAYMLNWAANIQHGDVYLEPSCRKRRTGCFWACSRL